MRAFSQAAIVVAGYFSLVNASSPTFKREDNPCTAVAVNASVDLGNWLECQVNNFFPYPQNGAWDTAYDNAFSKNLLASFNQSHFDFNGFRTLYKSFNATIGASFAKFDHGFLTTVAVPNSNGDKGGFVYATGWEGGKTLLGTDLWYTDAAYAVVQDVGGERKIVEFRESSNIPSSTGVTAQQNWTCKLP